MLATVYITSPSANLMSEYKGRWSHTMQVTIRAEDVILIGSLLAALGGIGVLVLWCVRFVDRQKRQDRELAAIRKEQTLICYGVKACLQGLREQGCNGPVSEALNKLDKHLNQAAHEEETL